MPYIGNLAVTGSTASNFKLLDDISTYTWSFNAADPSIVSVANDTLTQAMHRFATGQRVIYSNGGGSTIGGLTSGTAYYIVKNDPNTIKLAITKAAALAGSGINITGLGNGNHTITLAFDGVNKSFRPTHSGGSPAKVNESAQLVVTINGVQQKPSNTVPPPSGFGLDSNGNIEFPVAPTSADVFWGCLLYTSPSPRDS